MNSQFNSSEPNSVCFSLVDLFIGSSEEKNLVFDILNEWNNQSSLSDLCISWEKKRPENETKNLLILLFNCECLSAHLNDLDILLSSYLPHVIVLTGVGSQIRNSIKSKVIHAAENFLLVELNLAKSTILVGAVYLPPKTKPPFEEMNGWRKMDV